MLEWRDRDWAIARCRGLRLVPSSSIVNERSQFASGLGFQGQPNGFQVSSRSHLGDKLPRHITDTLLRRSGGAVGLAMGNHEPNYRSRDERGSHRIGVSGSLTQSHSEATWTNQMIAP